MPATISSRIALDGFTERSTSPYALAFAPASQTVRLMVLGLRADRRYERAWGTVRPNVRVEYRRRFQASFTQAMAYVDMPEAQYTLSGRSNEGDLLSGGVGVTLTSRRFSLGLEYGTSAVSLTSFDGHSFRVMLRRHF